MSVIASYDAKNVTITVGGTYITGFGDGTFVEALKDEDTFQSVVGAQGDVGISEINNPLGTVTLTLQQTSPSVAYLTRLANSKTEVAVWIISSGDVTEKIGGTRARVKKPAQSSFSNNIEQRQFEIAIFDFSQT